MQNDAIIHIVDDNAPLREALQSLFRSVGRVACGYPSVPEFLDSARQGGPGCIVLDVRLPGISGLDFQDRLDEFGVDLPVVLMSGHGDIPMSVRARRKQPF